jgi:hypothetical protein
MQCWQRLPNNMQTACFTDGFSSGADTFNVTERSFGGSEAWNKMISSVYRRAFQCRTEASFVSSPQMGALHVSRAFFACVRALVRSVED